MTWSRREFLAAAPASLLAASALRAESRAAFPPVRTITKGPNFHWFGYYDKHQFDPTNRFVLGMQVGFEHRSPKADDTITLGMIDLHDADRWTALGRSKAWNWQQGCMLQWRPGADSEIIWNDRDGDRFISRILNVKTNRERTVPHPVYALSPDGVTALAPDFRRLAQTRPGYGYGAIADPFSDQLAPAEAGITSVDLNTGKSRLILTLADLARNNPKPGMNNAKHWFNHLLFNPSGTRFVFLHRWRVGTGFQTRMITADPDGRNQRIVDDNGMTSHFIWRDDTHILAWSNQKSHGRKFYLFEDGGRSQVDVIGPDAMTQDGHCTYLPGNRWILCDTYPDKDRQQHPYLYHVEKKTKVPLGHFLSPKEYAGEWRCDTHPRISRDGKWATIDSPHTGGRQIHLIDLREIIAEK